MEQSTTKKPAQKRKAAGSTPSHESFEAAFAGAQMELHDPIKNSLNPHFKSEYVDLGTLMACVRPVLAKHGLTIHTEIHPEYTTTTEWTSGEGEPAKKKETKEHVGHRITAEILGYNEGVRSSILCPPQKNVQAFASFHTYARRWLIGGLCGVAEARDDDGNGAVSSDSRQEIINRAGR